MERSLEVHFFHGFLGLPSDWLAVSELLSNSLSYQPVFHNLWEDMNHLPSIQFKTWAKFKAENLGLSENRRIAVGYLSGDVFS